MLQMLSMMVGIPGSGKSSWLREKCADMERRGLTNYTVISRDEVRFSMLKDGQDYFANEKEVFEEFINRINQALKDGVEYIFVDATHVSEKARKQVLSKLHSNPDDVVLEFISIECPMEVALQRNEKREGLAKVPAAAIANMSKRLTHPSLDKMPEDTYGFYGVLYTNIPYEGE